MKRIKKQNRIQKRIFCGALAGLLTFTACGVQKKDPVQQETVLKTEKTSEETVPMGRYREESIKLPREVRKLFELKIKKDGTLQMLFAAKPGSLYLYESGDRGKTWQSALEIPEGDLPNGFGAADACIRPDGTIFLSAGAMAENPVLDGEAVGNLVYYNLKNSDGKAEYEEVSLSLPQWEDASVSDYGYGLRELAASDDGLLYGILEKRTGDVPAGSEIYCIDPKDGSVPWSRQTMFGSLRLDENVLFLSENERDTKSGGYVVKMLNPKNGEETGEVLLADGMLNGVDFKPEGKRVYYCDSRGIFSADGQMTLNEKLADGENSGLCEEGYAVRGFLAPDEGTFLVLMQDYQRGAMKIYRYEFDRNLPAVPEKQLTVYSLKQNDIMKKLVFDFGREHPEVAVSYEVGMAEAGIRTVSDAVNVLNTRIMAGDGPDLMVLNSLPWEAYSEKGILLDLSGEMQEKLDKGELYEKMFRAYQRSDSWYAVPVSFKVPEVFGKEETVGSIHSLESLTKAAARTGDTVPFARTEGELLRYLASLYWNEIQGEDGSISRERLKFLLEQTKELNDILLNYDELLEFGYGMEQPLNNEQDIFAQDTVVEIFDICDERKEMDLSYLSGAEIFVDLYNEKLVGQPLAEGRFSPLLAGINGKSENRETAELLMDFMLSEKEQEIFSPGAYPFMGNFPVNKKAFENMIKRPSEDVFYELSKYYRSVGREMLWPEPELRELNSMLEELSVPAMEDSMILQTILDHGIPCLKGETDADTAAREIARKLELHSAE